MLTVFSKNWSTGLLFEVLCNFFFNNANNCIALSLLSITDMNSYTQSNYEIIYICGLVMKAPERIKAMTGQ